MELLIISHRTERHALRLSKYFQTNLDIVIELVDLLGVDEAKNILKMTANDLRSTVRVNLLKKSRKETIQNLKEENIIAKPIKNIPEGLEIVQGKNKIGFSLSYLSGEIMPQGLGSMLTVDTLNPQPGEVILDMAAAPGGKTCFIGERLRGTGKVIANDISAKRYRSVLFNIARHGISNAEYLNMDAKKMKNLKVDRILLDAPCTGGGLIVSKPHRRISKDISDSNQLQKTQIQLLKTALSLLPKDGVCVYSTCAISPIENEMVVEKFRDQVEFNPLKIQGTDSILDDQIIGKRLFPHKDLCDGFFIVKMVKL